MKAQLFFIVAILVLLSSYANAQFSPKDSLHLTYPQKNDNPFAKKNPQLKAPAFPLLPKKNITVKTYKSTQKGSSAIVALKNPMTYSHNNKKGFDVYESHIDGMSVMIPDKANRESLGMVERKNPDIKENKRFPEKVMKFKGPSFLK